MHTTLHSIEHCVAATLMNEIIVRAVFDETAMIERQYAISEAYSRQTMSND